MNACWEYVFPILCSRTSQWLLEIDPGGSFYAIVMGYLLDWQKKALKQMDEGNENIVWIPGRASGRTVYMKAVGLLKKLNESLENNQGWENNNPTFQREYETRFE